jgi:transcriptional regulator, LysR family
LQAFYEAQANNSNSLFSYFAFLKGIEYKVRMDTDSLKAFLAVAECQSFSIAAERLHLTQPAVSKRIAALEERLNHSLFDRLGRSVQLTEAGERLRPQATFILQNIRETERSIRELSGEMVGSLKVATSHHIGLHHLPPILRIFASKYPKVNLQFEFLDSEQAHEKVINGDCELAVVTLAPELKEPLAAEIIWQDPLVFVTSPKHELAQRSQITLKDLSQARAILPDLNTFTGRLVKKCFDEASLPLRLNMATNYLETIKVMVSVGLGWSVLPATMLDSQLKEIPIAGTQLTRSLGVVTHKRRTLGNAARAFYDVLRAN